MIVLAGTVRIAPGRVSDALPHLKAMVEATRGEPGCLQFAFSFDVHDAHLVRIFEVFRDADALAAHRATPHFAAWRASWDGAGIGDREMMRFDVTDAAPI